MPIMLAAYAMLHLHASAIAQDFTAPVASAQHDTGGTRPSLIGISPLAQLSPMGSKGALYISTLLEPFYTLSSDKVFSMGAGKSNNPRWLGLDFRISFPRSQWKLFSYKGKFARWRVTPLFTLSTICRVDSLDLVTSSRPLVFEYGFKDLPLASLTVVSDWDSFNSGSSIEVQTIGNSGWEILSESFNLEVISHHAPHIPLKISWKGVILKEFANGLIVDKAIEELTLSETVTLHLAATLVLRDSKFPYAKLSELYFSKNDALQYPGRVIRTPMSYNTYSFLKPMWGH